MIDDIKKDAASRMTKSVESLGENLAKVRTGRAHPSLLDHLTVSYYGSDVPLKQVADIRVEWQPAKIVRRNRLSTVTVKSDVVQHDMAIAIVVMNPDQGSGFQHPDAELLLEGGQHARAHRCRYAGLSGV